MPEGSGLSLTENAFSGCARLKSLVIGKGVESISAGAFEGCGAIERIYFKSGMDEMPRILIGDNPELDDVEIYYYSEEEPEIKMFAWHYDESGVATPW